MAHGSGNSAFSPGYPGLAAALIQSAVLDARGRNEVCGRRARTSSEERRREGARSARASAARRWLAGQLRGRVSVHECCDGIGLDYDAFRERLEVEGVIGLGSDRRGRSR